MTRRTILAAAITSLAFAFSSNAQEGAHQHQLEATAEADSPKPLGHHPSQHDEHAGHSTHDMGDGGGHGHHHGAGMWMFEYKYSRMLMDDSLRGTEKVDTGMTMSMDMHMFHSMYSLTDNLTLMAMFHYMVNKMDMPMMDMAHSAGTGDMGDMQHKVAARAGNHAGDHNSPTATPTTVSGHGGDSESLYAYGPGDTLLAVLYKVADPLTVSLGLSIPTGPIDIKNGSGEYQPYAMQLGSGTYDLSSSISYDDNFGSLGYGAQFLYKFRIGENKRGYTLGNRMDTSAWLKYRVTEGVTLSTKLNYINWGRVTRDISRTDSIGIMDNPDSEGGHRVDAYIGISGMSTNMLTFAFEVGAPVYQNLYYGWDDMMNEAGSQMRTTLLVNASVGFMF